MPHLFRPRFSNRRAYAQTFAATAAIRCLGAFSGILAARMLLPRVAVNWQSSFSCRSCCYHVGEFEFSRSVIVESGKQAELSPRLISTAFWVAAILGVVEMAVLAIGLRIFCPLTNCTCLVRRDGSRFYLPASYITAALIGIDQGRGRFGRFSLFQVLPGLAYVGLIASVLWPSTSRHAAGVCVDDACRNVADYVRAGSHRCEQHSRRSARLVLGTRAPAPRFQFLSSGVGRPRSPQSRCVLACAHCSGRRHRYVRSGAGDRARSGGSHQSRSSRLVSRAEAQQSDEASALSTLAHHFRLAQLAALVMALAAAAITPWGIRVFFGPQFLPATTATYYLDRRRSSVGSRRDARTRSSRRTAPATRHDCQRHRARDFCSPPPYPHIARPASTESPPPFASRSS